eukprot:CFRG6050T1
MRCSVLFLAAAAVFLPLASPLAVLSKGDRFLEPVTDSPIIGILTQPNEENNLIHFGSSMIYASYVKWIEAAGGRVVPIHYDSSPQRISELFHSVNGVLYMGGEVDIQHPNSYYNAGRQLFELTVEANKQGKHTPLWGTCLGHELLAVLASEDYDILDTGFDAVNLSLPLTFTNHVQDSMMFAHAPESVMKNLATEAITSNEHVMGVTPKRFAINKKLNDFFKVLSVNKDRQGISFVSAIEAREYPIFGIQFHPEKNLFEFQAHHDTSHTYNAISAALYLATEFIFHARHNPNRFSSVKDEFNALIYASEPTRTYIQTGGHFEQMYFFNTGN